MALAQELVEAASALLHGRTINVMDLDGIIIASTEKNRIGTFHTGARLVVEREQDLAIRKEHLFRYPGAKEGYNMPLICKGEMIGVVGIFGEPDEVLDLGRLLKVYASKYFELEMSMNEKLMDIELKSKLFGLLMTTEENTGQEQIRAVMDILGIHFSYPVRAVKITKQGQGKSSRQDAAWGMEVLEKWMLETDVLHPQKDIWVLETFPTEDKGKTFSSEFLVILKSFEEETEPSFQMKLKEMMRKFAFHIKVSIGKPVNRLEQIKTSYHQVNWMDRYMEGEFCDIEEEDTYIDYMLERSCHEHETFLEAYIQRLKERFGEEELEENLQCVLCYYEEQHSVGAAAKRLFIHKNTLQYRMKRILETAELEKKPEFVQEYLLRLIIKKMQK